LLQSIGNEYRRPGPDIEALLLADPPPTPLLHTRFRRVAFVFREGSLPVDRLAASTLGLAGSLSAAQRQNELSNRNASRTLDGQLCWQWTQWTSAERVLNGALT
jgi:hypothetical protein